MAWWRFTRDQQAHVAALDEGLRNIAETMAATEQRKLITVEMQRATRLLSQIARDQEACAGQETTITPTPAKA